MEFVTGLFLIINTSNVIPHLKLIDERELEFKLSIAGGFHAFFTTLNYSSSIFLSLYF